MTMDSIDRLAALFERFPGIGPRQAQRFVQFLLRASPTLRRELAEAVKALGASVHQCPQCMRFHAEEGKVCVLCSNPTRDSSLLAVVAGDADLAALERSGTYHGRYFVLGGTISLASESTDRLRIRALLDSLPHRAELREIILAFPANPEGDITAARLQEDVRRACDEAGRADIQITMLGRGLSTGSELEYADPETLRAAFDSRK